MASLGFVASTLVGACSGSQPPIGAPGAVPQTFATITHADRTGSWMLAEAKSSDLLYVANIAGSSDHKGTITIYTYPQGKIVGSLKGFSRPNGLCVDKTGDVYVANFSGENIFEYAHGDAKPVSKLGDDGAPYGCAIDPTTGNLAVTNGCDGPVGSCYPNGTVLIYKRARGKPEVLNDRDIPAAMSYCAYDKDGNLFLDSYGKFYQIGFAELPAGSKTFKTLALKLPKRAAFAGGLQWVGKYLAVGFGNGNVVGEYSIKGNSDMRVHATLLNGLQRGFGTNQFWVQGTTLIAPVIPTTEHTNGIVEFFRYPQGGKVLKAFTTSVYTPYAAVISPAN